MNLFATAVKAESPRSSCQPIQFLVKILVLASRLPLISYCVPCGGLGKTELVHSLEPHKDTKPFASGFHP